MRAASWFQLAPMRPRQRQHGIPPRRRGGGGVWVLTLHGREARVPFHPLPNALDGMHEGKAKDAESLCFIGASGLHFLLGRRAWIERDSS
jgi:hypothetical protein